MRTVQLSPVKLQNYVTNFFLGGFFGGLSHSNRKMEIAIRNGVLPNKNLNYVALALELENSKWAGMP